MKTEAEIMSDFDDEKHEKRYCEKIKCSYCMGTDYSGEPNGYGCPSADAYVEKRYQSILKSRLKKISHNGLSYAKRSFV
jgi:hypothetical protein